MNDSPDITTGRHDAAWVLLLVLLVAAAFRTGVLVAGFGSLQDDPDSYARLAVNLADSGTFGFEAAESSADGTRAVSTVRATAYRPPCYPWLLSWLVTEGRLPRVAVAVLHGVLGVASVLLCFSVARQLGVWAWLPAIGLAFDPLLLRQSQLVMTETLAAFLVLLVWRLWLWLLPLRGEARSEPEAESPRGPSIMLVASIALGLLFGIGILLRPPFAVWAMLSSIWLFLLLGKHALQQPALWWRLVLPSLGLVLGMGVCVLPWMLRNERQLGDPIWATTHGGYTLLLANNPLLYDHFRRQGPSRGWDAEPFHQAWAARESRSIAPTERDYWSPQESNGNAETLPADPNMRATNRRKLDEVSDNDLAYSSAKATIQRNPYTFLLSSVYRVGWLWALWPYQQNSVLVTVGIGLWYAAWFIVAICFVWRRRRDLFARAGWAPGLTLLFALTMVHAVYWSNMRMRAPMMSVVYLLATPRVGIKKKPERTDERDHESQDPQVKVGGIL
ncbi:MAG: hypothetical protein NXI32_07395 [bacterium]|nr:hypothetical protein [bacterium]